MKRNCNCNCNCNLYETAAVRRRKLSGGLSVSGAAPPRSTKDEDAVLVLVSATLPALRRTSTGEAARETMGEKMPSPASAELEWSPGVP